METEGKNLTDLASEPARSNAPGAVVPAGDVSLACDLCGATTSRRGKKFTTPAEVWQHKKKKHAQAVEGQAPPAAVKPSVAARQAGGSGKRNGVAAAAGTGRPAQVQFCPCCGFNLKVVHAAMEFINGDNQP